MLVDISTIIVGPERPPADPAAVRKLTTSMATVGILSSITINREHRLIAGLHRLEAAKLLGWKEIDCVIRPLQGLEAELAELDEDVIRKDISGIVFGELLLRRKEVYETLYPETKAGVAQANGMNRALGNRVKSDDTSTGVEDGVTDKMSATLKAGKDSSQTGSLQEETVPPRKSFVDDTAEKMNVTPRTVRRQLQAAKGLNAEAGNIIKDAKLKISKKGTMELSRLEPDEQREAASMLVAGEVKTVEEYEKRRSGVEEAAKKRRKPASTKTADKPDKRIEAANSDPPFRLDGRKYATFEESAADLKNVDKEIRCTPDIFLAEFSATIDRIRRDLSCYREQGYQEAYPDLTGVQFQYMQGKVNELRSDLTALLNLVKGMKKT